jgi:glyoxylase-like metal-dependent hydrolase (beta-lactamase superfamily II)
MKRRPCIGAGIVALSLLGTGLQAQSGKTLAVAARRPEATAKPAASSPRGAVWANEFGLDVVRLSPRVAVVYGGPWDNAIVALATQKGIVVVDAPFSKTMARSFREAIRAEFKRDDFVYLINTHDHHCHVDGNEAFADIPIIGHDLLRRRMLESLDSEGWVTELRGIGEGELARVRSTLLKRNPKQLDSPAFTVYERGWQAILADLRAKPTLVPPTVTFDKELTLHLGDLDVRLIYYGHAHGIADTLVSIPAENLILTGGILYPTHVPILDKVTEEATPADVDNWMVVLRGLLNEATEDTRFLPSHHRAAMKKAQYQQFVAYLDGVWNGVRAARSKGKTLEQAKAGIRLADFPETARLPNEELRGTQWENLDIHGHNIEHLWNVLALRR